MSCWVVPAIAAELWGVSLAYVLQRVADGSVPSQREHGFLFVDVSNHGQPHQTTRKPTGPPPPTFVPVLRDADDLVFESIIAQELTGHGDESSDAACDADREFATFFEVPADDVSVADQFPGHDEGTPGVATFLPPAEWAADWPDDLDAPDAAAPADVHPPDLVLDPPGLAESVTVEEDPELPPLCEEEDARPLGDWRQRRRSVARTRRPPPMAA